jgi:hypothetical protein
VDAGRSVVATTHLILASLVAILAIIGLFGTHEPGVGTGWLESNFALLIVLPLGGCVALGLADWQQGRGSLILRAADIAAFLLAAVNLSLGATGIARWLAGSVALLACGGLAASIIVERPRRGGFRL